MLPKVLTNQNFWGCLCTPGSYTTEWYKSAWSNYRPAGHMWPVDRIFKACKLSQH